MSIPNQPAVPDSRTIEHWSMGYATNKLFADDCLNVIKQLPPESVDLIYLDPPFNSNVNYNVFFDVAANKKDRAQIEAFEDTWFYSDESVEMLNRLIEDTKKYREVSTLMEALQTIIPPKSSMLAYLSYMAERLVEMHRVLKPTGSVYFHCDPTASHYVKILMDTIFGRNNFSNEIVWCYKKWTNTANYFQRNHDIILMYAKSNKTVFNKQYGAMTPAMAQICKQGYNGGSSGGKKILRGYDRKNPKAISQLESGKYDDIYYLENPADGAPIPDYWNIPIIGGGSKERLGWPTQKPIALLDRIVKASSNKGDVVLEPFCGCGTTIDAAYQLQRNFIGIDVSYFALEVVRDHRMKRKDEISVEGEPRSMDTAISLFRTNAFLFEKWAVTRTHGLVDNVKQSGDGGIDGRGIVMGTTEKNRMCIVQVKGGITETTMKSTATAASIREFIGLLAMGEGIIGLFITMTALSEKQIREAEASIAQVMGPLMIGDTPYKRIVFHSIEGYLEGKKPDLPPLRHAPQAQENQDKLKSDAKPE